MMPKLNNPTLAEMLEHTAKLTAAEITRGYPTATADASNAAERRAVIRTSDRIGFKRCRRQWGWNSHLRHCVGPVQKAAPLWLGSGIHYALEDHYGYNVYGSPVEAFKAYCIATASQDEDLQKNTLPTEIDSQIELGIAMMEYYPLWCEGRPKLETYWVDGKPQVEVNFKIPIPIDPAYLKSCGYDSALYSGTIDRVAIDADGFLWIVEYKTAKIVQTMHFMTDPQVGVYCWAGEHIYERPFKGVVYQQHRKDLPNGGRILTSGEVSTAKQQKTSYRLYRQTLKDVYGESSTDWPTANIEYLNGLASAEDLLFDNYVRRDLVYRNEYSAEAEAQKIIMETEEMVNPHLSLYPNPTRDCAFMCSFQSACATMDDGGDWEHVLGLDTEKRDLNYDSWREYLPEPANQ